MKRNQTDGLLALWCFERRQWGRGTCMGCSGTVLSCGKWSVIGSTGRYRIIFPSGWEEETPTFTTELEAMLWVMKQSKQMPALTAAEFIDRALPDSTGKIRSSDIFRANALGPLTSTAMMTKRATKNTESESTSGEHVVGDMAMNAIANLPPKGVSGKHIPCHYFDQCGKRATHRHKPSGLHVCYMHVVACMVSLAGKS